MLEFADPIEEKEKKEAWEYIKTMGKYMEGAAEERKTEFVEGERVVHRVFGKGEILSIDTDKRAYLIQFEKMDTPREISFRVKMNKV